MLYHFFVWKYTHGQLKFQFILIHYAPLLNWYLMSFIQTFKPLDRFVLWTSVDISCSKRIQKISWATRSAAADVSSEMGSAEVFEFFRSVSSVHVSREALLDEHTRASSRWAGTEMKCYTYIHLQAHVIRSHASTIAASPPIAVFNSLL